MKLGSGVLVCLGALAPAVAAQAEGGTVKLLRGAWNKEFLDEIELFPFGSHDDQVDAASLALAKLGRRKQTSFAPYARGGGGLGFGHG